MNRRISPIVLNLIIINVLVFLMLILNTGQLIQVNSQGNEVYGPLAKIFLLFKSDLVLHRPEPGLFRPYQVITHMFSHFSIGHIFFNMFALYAIGTMVELVMKSKRFLALYLFSGIFSGITVALFSPSNAPVLGASGAISGVLVAFAFYYPKAKLGILFLPFQFTAKNFTWAIAGISAAFVLIDFLGYNIGGGISHAGHLAGMIGGAVFLYGNILLKKTRRR